MNVSIATERSKTAPLLIGFIPFALVGATVIFNLITLHAETTSVPYLNDGAIHSEMVRVATQQLRAGHLPLTGWFPQLGEGSPQFLHYQSLGAMLTGGIGLLTGPNVAYAWVLYLVLATWPISIFIAIRLLGFDRLSAGFGSMVSPFVISVLGIGYEQQAYFSIGYGLWSQLLAMWMLPLAWGFSWRAMQDRRALLPATIFVSATIAFHFLTGYLAIFGVIVAFVCSTNKLRIRLRNLAELVIAVGLTSAWVIVPLVKFRTWASINEFLQHGPDVNSYGARRVLSWLAMGQLFDAHRWPVLTTTLFLGLIFIMVRARRDPAARNILVLFIVCLLLFFGRTTFGPLFRLLPGGADLFLRRFLMGVQLAGIVIVGVALSSLARALAGHLLWISRRGASGSDPLLVTRRTLGLLLLVLLLAPAVSQTISIDHQENANIAFQQVGDRTDGAAIAPIISLVSREGGRVYAGLPSPSSQIGGWGSALTVGEVPVFKYLTDFDIDEVGYTLRTASLMTDPEFYFNDNVPSEFALFGVR